MIRHRNRHRYRFGNGNCECSGNERQACPLSDVQEGTIVKIKQLRACPEMCQRLREMGLCEDQQIRLLLKEANLICQLCNMRLGISQEIADSIIVEPVINGNGDNSNTVAKP